MKLMVILPVLLFRRSMRLASVSLCFFKRSMPTPMSFHSVFPSFFTILNTLLLISWVVSSSSSPSPSRSCIDVVINGDGASPAASGAIVPPVDPPAPFSSEASGLDVAFGGTPNENPPDILPDALDSASGVLGGLPNVNPTGFPKLPAFPNPPNADVLPGEADPKVNADEGDFSGVLNVGGPPNKVLLEGDPLLKDAEKLSPS